LPSDRGRRRTGERGVARDGDGEDRDANFERDLDSTSSDRRARTKRDARSRRAALDRGATWIATRRDGRRIRR
jgi:hypothetical protein